MCYDISKRVKINLENRKKHKITIEDNQVEAMKNSIMKANKFNTIRIRSRKAVSKTTKENSLDKINKIKFDRY